MIGDKILSLCSFGFIFILWVKHGYNIWWPIIIFVLCWALNFVEIKKEAK